MSKVFRSLNVTLTKSTKNKGWICTYYSHFSYSVVFRLILCQFCPVPEAEGVGKEHDKPDQAEGTARYKALPDTQSAGLKEVGIVPRRNKGT